MKKILVTGAAGFIGYHYARRLCEAGHTVLGIDNLDPYYDVDLKKARLDQLAKFDNFEFQNHDIIDGAAMEKLFADWKPEIVGHLAAQAGVRHSIENPQMFVDCNVTGFMNVLEGCRHNNIEHLIYASTSSVYGSNTKLPFSLDQSVDHPVSMYAATKKANELMAHTYAHLFGLPSTGLRFFTVYGPWGRPDMALYKFTKAIYEGEELPVYNHGDMLRDFTYVDDIVESLVRLVDHPARPDPDWSGDNPKPESSDAPYRIYNIGNDTAEKLLDVIDMLEAEIGLPAKKNMMPMQQGDVYATAADTSDLARDIGFKPATKMKDGIRAFVQWYREYHNMGNGPVLEKTGNG